MRAFPEARPAAGADFAGVAPVSSVGALAAAFDGFILDQWGVLHDGTAPYAGAVECLARLHASGKRIVVLSNSGKREADNLRLLERIGFEIDVIDRFVSAGEDARDAIRSRSSPFHMALGRRCYAFTRGGDRSLLEGIGLEFVDSVQDADFLAVIGTDSPERCAGDYQAELQAGLGRGLPMVCANPDIARITPAGLIEAPGVLAQRYEMLGGAVMYHGKPHRAIYSSCLAALGCLADKVIAIGDSVEHDVLGAVRVGIRSALIPGGVHGPELGVAWGQMPSPQRWQAFAAHAPAQPDYLLRAFNW